MVMHSLSPDADPPPEVAPLPVVGSRSRPARGRRASVMTQANETPARLDIGELYDQHGGLVYRRVRRFYSAEEAEEVVQEVFLRLLTTKATFRGESSVTTWLYQVTTRHCLNRLRNAKRRKELIDHHGTPEWGMPVSAARQEAKVFLEQLWAQLDEEHVIIGVYYFVDGLSHGAIAELVGVSRRTIGNRLLAIRDAVEAASEPKAAAGSSAEGGTP